MGVLLPSLALLVASTAVLLAACLWKARRRLGSRAGGSPLAEESPRRGPAAAGSPRCIPCGCGPGCGPCVAAARQLRDLVTPLWPGVSFPQDSGMWRLCWEDLEQLLERGHLPCCASSSSSESLQPSRSRQTPNGADPGDGSGCSLGAAGSTCPSLRMHVARKNLEMKLKAQPVPVRRSQERLVQQGASLSRSSESLSGSCRAPDGDAAADGSACSSGSAGIGSTRNALRMHVARKSLEVKLGARPAAVRSSQERVAGQEAPWCPLQPKGSTPRSESQKILQRQRELEFPHLRGAPPSRMRPLLAAQILLRMLCFK
ncbi:uncharacterized protein LOC134550702 [Prinia subflava]|uniref:uncharacterized protein LOC134550702 n=1 Tax=Prinia subflava TaxID=208062 RepID=UPI002FE21761